MTQKSLNQISDRSVLLLEQLYKMQTATDGVDRPELFSIDKTRTLDQFALDVMDAILLVQQAKILNQQVSKLTELGRTLESKGKIKVEIGDCYSDKTIEFMSNLLEKSDSEIISFK